MKALKRPWDLAECVPVTVTNIPEADCPFCMRLGQRVLLIDGSSGEYNPAAICLDCVEALK